MDEKRVRICDIADELGLSSATVSNVIHGKTGKVSDETARRVQALLEQRQYIPSMAGILLAQNDSGIIGIVVHDHPKYENRVLEDPFITSSLNHLSRQIEKSGAFMMVKTTADAKQIIRFASMWNMYGLILIGFCNEDYLWLRQHMRIPFVAYDAPGNEAQHFCNLNIDNFDGGRQVGRYFKKLGHKRALCIADNDTFVDHARYLGFCEGFPGGDFLQIPMDTQLRKAFYAQNFQIIRAYTAVFAVSDYYAVDLMHFLRSRGIRVPEDISVVGFDDTALCTQISPSLTSVRQDGALRAATAMEQLRQLKEENKSGSTVTLPVKLILRESACPP